MASDDDNITITVKVPFGGDRTVTTQPAVTVKDLTDTIMATCDTQSFRDVPQCIVQSGRILSESSTLREAGVSNGSVLHLMRRPRDERRIPGRPRSRSTRPGAETANDADDNDMDDDDDHDTEHHIHTNVIIGHIAVDGRIRYSDAHDMLLSVLHAIGFSTRAVRSAAAVAAAIAVATQSSEERGPASRTVLQNAWRGTRRLQEQLLRERNPDSADVFRRNGTDTRSASADDAAPSERTVTEEVEEADASRVKENASAQSPEEVQTSNGTAAAMQASRIGAPSTSVPAQRTPSALLPEDPPPTQDGETDLQASGRATDHLLPVLADILEVAVSRVRNAPSMVGLEGSDRLEAAEMLTEQLGSVASVATFVTTLVSTLLPDPDDLRTSHRMTRNRGSEGASSAEGTREGGAGASGADNTTTNASDGNGNTSASGTENIQHGELRTGRTGTMGSNELPADSENRNSSNSENASRPGSQPPGMLSRGSTSERHRGSSESNRRIRRSRRVRVSSSQAANADFMIRVLSYYFFSLCDIQIPAESGPPEVEGQTAVSVLDSLYGRNRTARPVNVFLRIVYFAMQKLTPRQFHEICRGNMSPLAAIRQDLWEEITRLLRRNHASIVERGDVEELFVDHICEALHEFVHVLESADEANEDGVFTPGPEDFCHHIMHIIQRKIEVFANILAIRRSEQEFCQLMSRWLKGAVGEIFLAIAMELEMQWDGLLITFRRAIYEIGKTIVGSQFSVIFPYIANLFANRAKVSYERSASRHPEARHTHGDRSSGPAGTNGDLDHSNCCPGCERREAMLDDDSVSLSHDSDDSCDCSHDETDSDMPALGDRESDDGFSDDSCDDRSDCESDIHIERDTSSEPMDHISMPCDLDDIELSELANELDTESKKTELNTGTEADLGDRDFEIMAYELATEVNEPIGKSSTGSEPSPKPRKLPTGPGKRMATMPPGGAANQVRASGMSPALSTPGSMPSSSVSRAAFSSAAVPRGDGSSSASVMKSDFENVLGLQDGLRWKQVVDRDRDRVRERRYGPLSRGYSGDKSVVQPLNTKRGSELAAIAAREAAKQARLSPDGANELERMAAESGPQYMEEMERAIGSRLLSDPDFNRQSFPLAAKRFLPK